MAPAEETAVTDSPAISYAHPPLTIRSRSFATAKIEGSKQEAAAQGAQSWDLDTELTKISHLPVEGTDSPVPYFHFLERLKSTKREGWRRFGINHGESISDHMYRMALMTLLAPPSISGKLDMNRCRDMALIHDMAESLVGDITPVDNVPKDEKSRREAETMDYLCTRLLGRVDSGEQGKRIRSIWQEYEDSQTAESKFVHDIDKVELIHQMLEYERRHEGQIDLSEFGWVASRIQSEEVKKWADEVLEERQRYWNSIGKEAPMWEGGNQKRYATHRELQEKYYGNGVSGEQKVQLSTDKLDANDARIAELEAEVAALRKQIAG